MRTFAPLLWVSLAGCFYIDAADEDSRLSLLDGDTDTDTDTGGPALTLEVIDIDPALLLECGDDPVSVAVTGRVNEAYEQQDFTVFARVDDGQNVPIGTVTSSDGISGFANLNFPLPFDHAQRAALIDCGLDSCEHDLVLSAEAHNGGAQATSAGFAFLALAAWDADGYLATGSAIDDEGTALFLASNDFADRIGTNPDGGVSVEEFPTLQYRVSIPWFAAGGEPDGWDFDVVVCPQGEDPVTSSSCVAQDAAWEIDDSAAVLTLPTAPLGDRSCADPSAPWDDVFVRVDGDPCVGTSFLRMNEAYFRFVHDDCDADGSPAAADCDDADDTVRPGLQDVCDGVDRDCDGTTEFEVPLWPDVDGDGHGALTGGTFTLGCPSMNPTLSPLRDDCDDTKASVNPDAVDTCDGVDTNCAAGETDAAGAVDAYADADGDKHGAGAAIRDCAANHTAAGRVASDDDCEDADANVYPGHSELCATEGVDNDCDGDAGESTDKATWYLDFDDDGYGDVGSTRLACGRPVTYVSAAGDCDDSEPDAHPGGLEVCDSALVDEDCSGTGATRCKVGDACLDDLACATGSCGASGTCERWTLWSQGAGEESYPALAIDDDGRRIWAFRSDSASVAVAGVAAPGAAAGLDWVIARTDEGGTVQSVSRIQTSGVDTPSAVAAEDNTGRYAVAGSLGFGGSTAAATYDGQALFPGASGSGHVSVVVFDASDSAQWGYHWFDTGDGTAHGAAFLPDGDVVVGGVVNRPTTDLVLARLEEDPSSPGDGRVVWTRKVTPTGNDYFGGLDVAPDGDIVAVGAFGASSPSVPGTLTLGNGCSLTADDQAGDAFIARFAEDGTCEWVVPLHGANYQYLDAVAVDPVGRAYFVGHSRRSGTGVGHSVTLGASTLPVVPSGALGGDDIVVGCVDDKGVPQWLRAMGSSADDRATAVDIDLLTGDVVVTGMIGVGSTTPNGRADLGSGVLSADSLTDVFAARFSAASGAPRSSASWPSTDATDAATDIVADPRVGGLLITGYSNGYLDFGDALSRDVGTATPGAMPGVFLASIGGGALTGTYLPTGCDTLHTRWPTLPSGVWPIDPDGPYGTPSFYARCDMTTLGGGWTRIATFRGDVATCSLTNAFGGWNYAQLSAAQPGVHAWMSAASVAPIYVRREVHVVPGGGNPQHWYFRTPNNGWTDIANGTVNSGTMAPNGVLGSKDGAVYAPLVNSAYCPNCLLGGDTASAERTVLLGAGSVGRAGFVQDSGCAPVPYGGFVGIYAAPTSGSSTWGIGGDVYVR